MVRKKFEGKIKKLNQLKRVEITWLDIQEYSGWNSSADDYFAKRVISTGFLIHKDRFTIKITSCVDPLSIDEAYGSVLVIPVPTVLSLKFLR